MMAIAERYLTAYGRRNDAARIFAEDLMRGDAAKFKAGYTKANAVIATAEAFELSAEEKATLERAVTRTEKIRGRRSLCSAEVTLDGAPAAIGGALNDFATVRTLDCARGAEWAWETAARIITEGGAFKL